MSDVLGSKLDGRGMRGGDEGCLAFGIAQNAYL